MEKVRLQLVLPRELMLRLDEWRRLQKDIPSRSEAIRRLMEQGVAGLALEGANHD